MENIHNHQEKNYFLSYNSKALLPYKSAFVKFSSPNKNPSLGKLIENLPNVTLVGFTFTLGWILFGTMETSLNEITKFPLSFSLINEILQLRYLWCAMNSMAVNATWLVTHPLKNGVKNTLLNNKMIDYINQRGLLKKQAISS